MQVELLIRLRSSRTSVTGTTADQRHRPLRVGSRCLAASLLAALGEQAVLALAEEDVDKVVAHGCGGR